VLFNEVDGFKAFAAGCLVIFAAEAMGIWVTDLPLIVLT
jgi:hypothetical protein